MFHSNLNAMRPLCSCAPSLPKAGRPPPSLSGPSAMVWRHFKLNDVKGEEASGNGGLYHPSLAPPRIMNGNGPPCSSLNLNTVREQGGPKRNYSGNFTSTWQFEAFSISWDRSGLCRKLFEPLQEFETATGSLACRSLKCLRTSRPFWQVNPL